MEKTVGVRRGGKADPLVPLGWCLSLADSALYRPTFRIALVKALHYQNYSRLMGDVSDAVC